MSALQGEISRLKNKDTMGQNELQRQQNAVISLEKVSDSSHIPQMSRVTALANVALHIQVHLIRKRMSPFLV